MNKCKFTFLFYGVCTHLYIIIQSVLVWSQRLTNHSHGIHRASQSAHRAFQVTDKTFTKDSQRRVLTTHTHDIHNAITHHSHNIDTDFTAYSQIKQTVFAHLSKHSQRLQKAFTKHLQCIHKAFTEHTALTQYSQRLHEVPLPLDINSFVDQDIPTYSVLSSYRSPYIGVFIFGVKKGSSFQGANALPNFVFHEYSSLFY